MDQLGNGSHYGTSEGYFEWWYFHFASASGFTSNVVLHETDIFGLARNPYVSMSFQLPHREPQYLRMAIPVASIARGYEHLFQSSGFFRETEDKIEIRLPLSSGDEFEVVITKRAQPLIFNDCVLYQESHKKNHWRLQVPFGRFNGVLRVHGEEHSVEGVAYHDHQWGNIPLQNFVSDWVWGHFSSSEGSATFFAIQTQKGELIERYAVVTPQSVQSSFGRGQVPHLADLAQSSSPELWRGEPVVTFPFGTTLRTTISPESLLRSRVGEVHGVFVATYLRWARDAALSSFDSFLYGITEYIRIRKESEGSEG